MNSEEAAAFSSGEFRGMVLTKLDSIQEELRDHKKGHRKPDRGLDYILAGLAIIAASGTTAGILLTIQSMLE